MTEAIRKKALITGITGQDGSYLAELLIEKGYEVHGIVRRTGVESNEARMSRIVHLLDKVTLHHGDITNYSTIWKLIDAVRPDEVYHLASQSQVAISFEDEFGTMNTNINGTHYILSAIKELVPRCKFYFAATSEMFGKVLETPQNEQTPFNPVSPYGISKVAGFFLTKMFREAYGIFGCSGILFNHESPRRGFEFVTRRITLAVAAIKNGTQKELKLGNLDAKRDWGFAPDYVEAMWLMLQQPEPEDLVIATGETHSVREFVEVAFKELGLEIAWEGEKEAEVGLNRATGKPLIKIDPVYYRPTEVDILMGNPAKAKAKLGWEPKVKFDELARLMVRADLEKVNKRGY